MAIYAYIWLYVVIYDYIWTYMSLYMIKYCILDVWTCTWVSGLQHTVHVLIFFNFSKDVFLEVQHETCSQMQPNMMSTWKYACGVHLRNTKYRCVCFQGNPEIPLILQAPSSRLRHRYEACSQRQGASAKRLTIFSKPNQRQACWRRPLVTTAALY